VRRESVSQDDAYKLWLLLHAGKRDEIREKLRG
jgi:hypothetical protein